jgi:DNA-binding CsgD family transcriptional regulator
MRKKALVLYRNTLEREQLSSLFSCVASLHLTFCKEKEGRLTTGFDLVVCIARDLMKAYQYKMHLHCPHILVLLPKNLRQMCHLLNDDTMRALPLGCSQHSLISAVASLLSEESQVCERRGNITKRERQILCLLLSGQDTQSIASALGIKVSTVTVHKKHLFYKSGVHSISQLLLWALFTQYGDLA